MTLPTALRRSAALARTAVLVAAPHGGQAHARRNAWVGMSADAARGRDRRQAELALAEAERRACARAQQRDGSRG